MGILGLHIRWHRFYHKGLFMALGSFSFRVSRTGGGSDDRGSECIGEGIFREQHRFILWFALGHRVRLRELDTLFLFLLYYFLGYFFR